jgi:hypothetical protein
MPLMATLNQSVSGFLDGTGSLTLKFGPQSAREVWHPDTVRVSANQGATNEATCTIFEGDVQTKRFVDATSSGSFGDSTGKMSKTIKVGTLIWATWTGGDAGVQATLTVTGTKDV